MECAESYQYCRGGRGTQQKQCDTCDRGASPVSSSHQPPLYLQGGWCEVPTADPHRLHPSGLHVLHSQSILY